MDIATSSGDGENGSRGSSVYQEPVARSCLMCYRRKIRCDKRLPCSNCIRSNNQCQYPGPDRPMRKPQKLTICQLDARLASIEHAIHVLSRHTAESKTSTPIALPSQNMGIDTSVMEADEEASDEGTDTEELLVEEGDSSRYVNDKLLSRILDTEQELQSALGTPNANRGYNDLPTVQLSAILSHFCAPIPGSPTRHPSPRQAAQLWRTFVRSVDPLAKILHIPTVETIFFEAANNPSSIEHSRSALLFAIYLSAITSLEDREVVDLMGRPRVVVLEIFKIGLEQALAAADFLETPNTESVQAIALYINCLRAYTAGRSVWTLLGLAIRSAQSIGLHRDGTNLKLSPFKTEMRRRLWWFLISREFHAVEDYGIEISKADKEFDTRLPSNLEDNDLFPDMLEIPPSKSNWTGMSPCLAIIETVTNLSLLYKSSAEPRITLTSANEALQNLRSRLDDTYLKHCNQTIPLQRFVSLLVKMMLAKNAFVIQQRCLRRTGTAALATEEYLIAACEILELDLQLKTDLMLRDFQSVVRTYTQYHPLTYMLWHLCVKPVGPTVERALNVVEKQFEIAAENGVLSQAWSKWSILQALRRKVVLISQSLDQETNGFINTMTNGASGVVGDTVMINEASLWDICNMDMTDWSMMVGEFGTYDSLN